MAKPGGELVRRFHFRGGSCILLGASAAKASRLQLAEKSPTSAPFFRL